jgi:hypothetical protein
MTRLALARSLAVFGLFALCSAPAFAQQAADKDIARDDEIAELKRQLSTVVTELEQLRSQVAAPEVPPALESENGFGPAASKVYSVTRGVSIGGYVEGHYANAVGDAPGQNQANLDRAVLYVGYKFNDWIVWNSEIEFENGTTEKNGSVSVEFATLDFLLDPRFNLRVGELLIPMGIVNEVHEPPFYYSVFRPQAEQAIIPATWADMGVGVFGRLGERFQYRFYVVNGLDARGYESSGLREGRQGASEAIAQDLAYVGRLEWEPLDGLVFGGSYYSGDAGQSQTIDIGGVENKLPNAHTSIWELHSTYAWRGLTTRALWTQARVGNASELSSLFEAAGNDQPVISRRMIGGYVEAAYDIMPLFRSGSEQTLEPFFRFEYVDTQNDVPQGFVLDRMFKQRIYIPGIQWKPIPNVVLKLDYRNVDDFAGEASDEVDIGFGLVF